MTPFTDWNLPPGVDRGLWLALHSEALARTYDEQLAGTPLLATDLRFALTHLPTTGRLVDLGCGTGRLALAFARLGCRVTAVDLSEPMLTVLGEKARQEGLAIDRVRANLVELDALRSGVFDSAACLFSTLGLIRGTAHRQRALTHIARILRPGGRLVLHVHNRGFSLTTPAGRREWLRDWWRDEPGDRLMPGPAGGEVTLHLFGHTEVKRLLRSAGLRLLRMDPIGIGPEDRLPHAWWWPTVRAYGWLILAEVPSRVTAPPTLRSWLATSC